jgi:transposase-like protein
MERRKFTREYKLKAVKLIKDRGVSYAQAAEDLGVHPTQLRQWVKKFANDPQHAFPGQGQMKPEQIAKRLPIDFPDDDSMRISHEAIYQALFVQGRGALRRDLTACLRSGRALRVPRARAGQRGKGFVSSEIMISEMRV